MRYFIIPVMLIFASTTMYGVPAYTEKVEFKQKNGTAFVGHIRGDEWFSWIEDEKSNIILYNKNSSQYEYATVKEVNGEEELVPSGVAVYDSNGTYNMSRSREFSTISKEDLRGAVKRIWKRKREEAKRSESPSTK